MFGPWTSCRLNQFYSHNYIGHPEASERLTDHLIFPRMANPSLLVAPFEFLSSLWALWMTFQETTNIAAGQNVKKKKKHTQWKWSTCNIRCLGVNNLDCGKMWSRWWEEQLWSRTSERSHGYYTQPSNCVYLCMYHSVLCVCSCLCMSCVFKCVCTCFCVYVGLWLSPIQTKINQKD